MRRSIALLVIGLTACHPPAPPRRALLSPGDPWWRSLAPDSFRAQVVTTKGTFVVAAYRAWAPRGVDRFYQLIRAGYYDDSRFFRVVPGYIAQFGIAGDPAVSAVWRDRVFPDDPEREKNLRGTFAFAMRGPDDRRTQVYINLRDNPRNDGQGFAILGRVIQGMDVVDQLYSGYGDSSGGGMRAGHQDSLLRSGNRYLDRAFPRLDRLVRVTVLP